MVKLWDNGHLSSKGCIRRSAQPSSARRFWPISACTQLQAMLETPPAFCSSLARHHSTAAIICRSASSGSNEMGELWGAWPRRNEKLDVFSCGQRMTTLGLVWIWGATFMNVFLMDLEILLWCEKMMSVDGWNGWRTADYRIVSLW